MDEESISNDYGICIICQTNTGPTEYTHMVMNPAMTSVTRIIQSAVERCGYGDSQFMALKTRLQGMSAEDLISNAVRYHRNCYAQLTSKTSLIEPRPGLRRALHHALCRTSERRRESDQAALILRMFLLHQSAVREMRRLTRKNVSSVRITRELNYMKYQLRTWGSR